jgi:hypothetical protein
LGGDGVLNRPGGALLRTLFGVAKVS